MDPPVTLKREAQLAPQACSLDPGVPAPPFCWPRSAFLILHPQSLSHRTPLLKNKKEDQQRKTHHARQALLTSSRSQRPRGRGREREWVRDGARKGRLGGSVWWEAVSVSDQGGMMGKKDARRSYPAQNDTERRLTLPRDSHRASPSRTAPTSAGGAVAAVGPSGPGLEKWKKLVNR
ncbi:hypothetical protein MVEN_00491600 [Mycena venus]|uniref:Uncharacterized protein n=1 Tax=Mycena venus TaxID=2733690 RepID=A0A8H7DB05_9AGAR|nr:hypothetical protein MVEN_00491600 [Mycena venus]